MSTFGSPNPFFISGGVEEETTRSLRFNRDDNAYLQATLGNSNVDKWTWSGWVKKTVNGQHQNLFSSGSDVVVTMINFDNNDKLKFQNWHSAQKGTKITTRVFRDNSAWMHIVAIWDSGNSTADDRIRLYVNGTRETDFSSSSNPDQNQDSVINGNTLGGSTYGEGKHFIGKFADLTDPSGTYKTEINFIDGQAYDPSYFAETNSVTGQWIPKKYTGSYGTNGFYLNFSDNSGTTATTLGKDSSGNDNNFTPNNFSVSAGEGNDSVIDSPNNNFCTLNPLDSSGNSPSNGNLQGGTAGTSGWRHTRSTIALPSTGKWYWEYKVPDASADGSNGYIMGIAYSNLGFTQDINSDSTGLYGRQTDSKYNNSSSSPVTNSAFTSISNNDILQFAYDADGQKLYTGRNDTWEESANPSTGSNPNWTSVASGGFPMVGSYGSSRYVFLNCGQQGFIYTPPTGYKSLCSKNLPDPTIPLPNRHFDTLTWTGNSTKDRSITGLNFKPSWVWIKSRTSSAYGGIPYYHLVWDVMRGAGADTVGAASRTELTVSQNYEEGRGANYTDYYGHVSAFNSDGFTLDHIAGQPAIYTNLNNKEYVGWSWNAGQTDGATYKVVVVSDSGNKYRFRNSADNATFAVSAVTLNLAEGGTYIFDQSDSSNAGHPLRFYTAADKTGGEYTTGVTTAGTPGSSGAYTQIVIAASAPTLFYQCSAHAGMGGQINTNSLLGSTNFDGDVTPADEVPTVKANPTAGFSMVTYKQQTGTYHIGHGLGVAPQLIITKTRSAANNWWTHTTVIDGTLDYAALDLNQVFQDSQAYGLGVPTSLVFEDDTDFTSDNADNIAYLFTSVEGYSKVGKFTGNGNANGTFVYTGFRPAYILFKNSSTTTNWEIYDTKRPYGVYNPAMRPLYANHNYVEETHASLPALDILSNGFKPRSTWDEFNKNGDTIIYYAIAEAPFKNARAR